MVKLTRLNGSMVMVNALLIEMVEAVPDTVVTLTTGKKLIIRESMEEVRETVVDFLVRVGLGPASYYLHREAGHDRET